MKSFRQCWRVLVLLAVILAGCGRVYTPEELGVEHWHRAKLPARKFPPGSTLRLLTWKSYIVPEIFDLFEKTYGVHLEIEAADSNYEILQKITAPGARYDLFVAAGFVIEAMRKRELLAPLDLAKVPLLSNIPAVERTWDFDPGLKFSVPYFFSALGFAFRVREVDGMPSSWDFWRNPKNAAIYAGRISLPNDPRFVLGSALLYLNRSPDSTNPADLEAAAGLLREFRRQGNVFLGSDVVKEMVNGNIMVSWMWSGDAAVAVSKTQDVRFLIPDGPVIVYHDCYGILRSSPQSDLAHFFINFMLIPEIAGQMSNVSRYMTLVESSHPFIDRLVLNGPAGMLPAEENRIELRDLGEFATMYDKVYADIQGVKPERQASPLPPHLRAKFNRNPGTRVIHTGNE